MGTNRRWSHNLSDLWTYYCKSSNSVKYNFSFPNGQIPKKEADKIDEKSQSKYLWTNWHVWAWRQMGAFKSLPPSFGESPNRNLTWREDFISWENSISFRQKEETFGSELVQIWFWQMIWSGFHESFCNQMRSAPCLSKAAKEIVFLLEKLRLVFSKLGGFFIGDGIKYIVYNVRLKGY